ncbi:MAG: pirin family protein [Blastochloris viridis]|uniref:Pirin family protein n=1 Tax=Blastochloris viridis TaxID=1079 RepID=A0A6N4R0T7_BLAVI|nr:MAG: pirin family protein [Blastochloris viridis]
MMNIQKFNELGKADFGWLQARHHFSFGRYYNPARMGFGNLRVMNDDRVAAGNGFDPHPHDNMEIITYVRKGEIRHRDNMGNEGATPAGSVQVMSAGTGVAHAEYASDTEPTVLYQIWLLPNEQDVKPRWDMREFPTASVEGELPLLVSGNPTDAEKGALFIHADGGLHGGRMKAGTTLTQDFGAMAYVLVSDGRIRLNGEELDAGDGAAMKDEGALTLEALEDAEVVVIRVSA